MFQLRLFHALAAAMLTLQIIQGISESCISLQTNSEVVAVDSGYEATLTFTIKHGCLPGGPFLKVLKVFKSTTPHGLTPLCNIRFIDGTPKLVTGCTRNSVNQSSFNVTRRVSKPGGALWFLAGQLTNAETFDKTVCIEVQDSSTSETTTTGTASTTTRESTQSADPNSTPVSGLPSSTTTTITTTGPVMFYILGGGLGFVLLAITVLCICVGILFWKKGRQPGAPYPPPPQVGCAAPPVAVVFHAQPAEQDGSESSVCVSVQSHVYAEIPEDSDFTSTDNSLTIYDSSPVSDSSWSDDCLHHIACPSSDSSLPEDYLHPVESDVEVPSLPIHKRPASDSSSSSEAVMYSGTTIFCGTPTACKNKHDHPYKNVLNV